MNLLHQKSGESRSLDRMAKGIFTVWPGDGVALLDGKRVGIPRGNTIRVLPAEESAERVFVAAEMGIKDFRCRAGGRQLPEGTRFVVQSEK